MADETLCRNCGAPLTHDARDGVCPKCLLEQVLKGGDEDREPGSAAVGLKVRNVGDYELLEEIK